MLTKPYKKSPSEMPLVQLVLVIFLAMPKVSWAAACCGGGFTLPTLITGDDLALTTISYAYSTVDTDVFTNGVWQKRRGDDTTQILKLEGAKIFEDRWQVGASLPIQTRDKNGFQGGSSSGLGDISGQMGYEYLPDWNYNPWRPRGIGFLNLILPTGKSIYESDDVTGLDSRGRGFFAVGAGTSLTKFWDAWDANFIFEYHRAFQKTVNNSQLHGTIKPGFGGTISVGGGYNFKNFRVGLANAWVFEDAIDVTGDNASQGSAQRYATTSLTASYYVEKKWILSFIYSDQTLFGSPLNTTLSKSAALYLTRRWER